MKAILFDLDGTLLDTLQDIADACNAALTRHGFPAHAASAYRHFVGDGVAALVSRAVPGEQRNDKTLAAVAVTYRQEYQRRWDATTRVYEGIPVLLDDLSRRGIALTVLSNKPHDFTQACVRRFLGGWRFSMVLGASQKFPAKPNPAGALHIAAQLNMPANEFVYLGDTATDMKTAISAGMVAVGALWGFRDEKELRESGAKHLIRNPLQLLEYVGTAS